MVEMQIVMQHILNELEDVHHYLNLYHDTNNGVYKDLANEELSHAQILNNMMVHDHGSNAEIAAKLEEAQELLLKAE